MEKASKLNPDNVSAKAALALAYFHTGKWNEWVVFANKLEDAEPGDEYREFDELFLAYLWFYSAPEKALLQLETIVPDHPDWIIPQVILANLRAHQAVLPYPDEKSQAEKIQLAEQALDEIQRPLALASDNPFVLLHSLFLYSAALEVTGDGSQEIVDIANEIADKLANYPEYSVGSLVRAGHHDRNADLDEARLAWNDLLMHGHGAFVPWSLSALYIHGEGRAVINRITSQEPEAQIAKAYILALSNLKADKDQARKIFDELVPAADTWFRRYQVIQIPLLLQDPLLAKKQSKEWLRDKPKQGEVSIALGGFEQASIQYIVGPTNPPFDPSSTSVKERFYANYQMALLSFANKDVQQAVNYLRECDTKAIPHLRWWVEIFQGEFAESTQPLIQ